MSQDLLSAFGSPPASTQPNHDSSQTGSGPSIGWPNPGFSNASEQARGADANGPEDDDDFGDFEDASAAQSDPAPMATAGNEPQRAKKPLPTYPPPKSQPPPPKPKAEPKTDSKHPFAGNMDILFAADDDDEYNAGADDLGDISTNPEAAVAYSKKVIAAQQEQPKRDPPPSARGPPTAKVVSKKLEPRQPNKLKKKSGYAPAKDPNVLFDAENLSEREPDDDNDFGDFEETVPASKPSVYSAAFKTTSRAAASNMPAMDLLGLDDATDPPQQPATHEVEQHVPGRQPHTQAPQEDMNNDAWDDFEEPPEPAPKVNTAKPPSRPSTAPRHPPPPKAGLLPPTNVPPPAMLLSIFPSILASAEEALFTPLSKLEFKQRQMLLSHPATHMFLAGYLNTSIALAHILAGRKQRWKRDQHLAQSMRIGPSAAGGKGGMKLAGLDKSEAAKEDREVLDTVNLWKRQVGKLRGAVTAASSSPKARKLPPVPEIAEVMPVKALKAVEGGFVAPQPCALCGLKREERVAKVDTEVDDSFGEWWVQGLNMHLVCQKFWDEYQGKLRSR